LLKVNKWPARDRRPTSAAIANDLFLPVMSGSFPARTLQIPIA
jgi:hypothetical protein